MVDKNGNKITSTFNSDGSGTRIIESKDSKGRPKKTVSTYGKDNKLLKNVTTSAAGTYTSEYSYGENGKCTSEKVHCSRLKEKYCSLLIRNIPMIKTEKYHQLNPKLKLLIKRQVNL